MPHDSDFPVALFFPEVISFGIAVVLAPVWAVRFAQEGYYAQAIAIAMAGVLFGTAFVWLLRKGRRWFAWFVMASFFLALWALASTLPPWALNRW